MKLSKPNKDKTKLDMKFDRNESLSHLKNEVVWDVVVIGGGATGLGVAVDSASRGYKTILLESHDFAKGTSSRSTKLVHGGVRYMANGDISLVKEALRERGLLAKNATHLFKNQSFVIPNYNFWGGVYYKIGLSIYDLLAGKLSLGRTKYLSKSTIQKYIPTINPHKLANGVLYQDGQFDDARLAINLAQTAVEQGAVVLNYCSVIGFEKDKEGKVIGVEAKEKETGVVYKLKSKAIVNATGVFTNEIMQMDNPDSKKTIIPSQGIHLVLDQSFLPSNKALMIPKTSDGRVLFAVPWHGKVIIGTTDTLIKECSYEPYPLEREIDFILETAQRFLVGKPTRKDVKAVFSGLRPLAAPSDQTKSTKEISRSHKIIVSKSGIVSMIGGKWTTYRKMAEEIVDKLIALGKLDLSVCRTEEISIHGNSGKTPVDFSNPYYVYGSDMDTLERLRKENPEYQEKIHPEYAYRLDMVAFAVKYEMAIQIEDVLARRLRLLFLDAKAAQESAPKVAICMANLLGKGQNWIDDQLESFKELSNKYLLKC